MKNLCIVPCAKRKIWDNKPDLGPVEAKYAYVGPFSTKCRKYAEKFHPGEWCILSAKYGFVLPEEMISGPYDVSFNDKKTCPITIDELIQQIKQKRLDEIENVVVLGGKRYATIAEKAFLGKSVSNPLANCRGLGYMMQKINQAIRNGDTLFSMQEI
jgi:hypothetical protein